MSRVGRVVSFIRRHYGLAVSQLTATEPTDAQEGDLWVDISTPSSPALMIFDGATWQAAGGGSDFSGAYGDLTGIPSTFAPSAHASSHQDGGADEISVQGLAGLLVTAQTPAAHKTSHEDGGSDEISVAGLAGLLVTAQTPAAHTHGITAFKRVYQNILVGAATSVTISGLTGDTEILYLLVVRTVFSVNSTVVGLQFNADGGGNYGDQDIKGTSTTTSSARNTGAVQIGLQFSGATAAGRTAMTTAWIMPKSGFKRHVNMVTNDDANGTTIVTTAARTGVWSNTADQITSMTVLSSQTNGLAVGTVIELYAATAI